MNTVDFVKGLVVGGDSAASMAKVMSWIVLGSFLYITMFRPNQNPDSLLLVFQSLLVYVLGGKFSGIGRESGRDPGRDLGRKGDSQ